MLDAEAATRAWEVESVSRSFAKGARANPPGNGLEGGRRAGTLESPGASALPDAPDSIRVRTDDDEAPALVFNDRAPPGALVSWAWCQLKALDALLCAVLERPSAGDDDTDLVGAVHDMLVPVVNALAFSERRAHERACARKQRPTPRGRRDGGARKKKNKQATG